MEINKNGVFTTWLKNTAAVIANLSIVLTLVWAIIVNFGIYEYIIREVKDDLGITELNQAVITIEKTVNPDELKEMQQRLEVKGQIIEYLLEKLSTLEEQIEKNSNGEAQW